MTDTPAYIAAAIARFGMSPEAEKMVAEALAEARAAGARVMRDHIADWLRGQRPELSGPDYGMASEAERRELRATFADYTALAGEIRALPLPGESA